MLVSESRGFLFVHVQKTAGTSLTRLLEPWALQPDAGRWNRLLSDAGLQRDWRQAFYRKHAPLRVAEKRLPAEHFESLFKFAFVRNPWDRMASWHRYVLATPSHHLYRRTKAGDFDAFLQRMARRLQRSQWCMLVDSKGRMRLDFVGRFERLHDDVREVARRLQLPKLELAPAAAAPRDYRSLYSEAGAELVAKAFATEIEYFGYRFDP
jgi:hypothetical protein